MNSRAWAAPSPLSITLAVFLLWGPSARAFQAAPAPDAAKPAAPAWRDKQIPEWSEADAKQLLADSPWAKSATATADKTEEKSAAPDHRGGRRRGLGGLTIGGIGRRAASNDASSNGSSDPPPPSDSGVSSSSSTHAGSTHDSDAKNAPPPTLRLRWESALPVREAELKARDTAALAVDEDHYAIAVYGIPARIVKEDSRKLAEQLKSQAAIKRNAKADMKPSSVEIRIREDGPVILYLFPRTGEITWRDHDLEFNAQVGNFKVKQSFLTDDMRFHDALEL